LQFGSTRGLQTALGPVDTSRQAANHWRREAAKKNNSHGNQTQSQLLPAAENE
jgi:hypothetical protein